MDFPVGDEPAVEVKAARRVGDRDLGGLRALQEEAMVGRLVLVSQDPVPAVRHGVHCLHWSDFLERLCDDRLLA